MNASGFTSERNNASGSRLSVTAVVDHTSRLLGLAVAQFYLVCVVVTVWEIFARYALNEPTAWAFEIVMTFSSSAWLLSVGYITLFQRHIGITVIHSIVSIGTKWWLDLFAMTIGVIALTLFLDDNIIRALLAIDRVERTGSSFNSPQPMILKTFLSVATFLYLSQLLVNLWRHLSSKSGRAIVVAVAALIYLRAGQNIAEHYNLGGGIVLWVDSTYNTLASYLNPQNMIDARSHDLGLVTACMVGALFSLMLTGMPLGVVTLIVAVGTALVFFGPQGLFLVSSNAFGLTEQYAMVAVPLFVLMASILERAGIARDLFDAMSIFAGRLRGGVAVQTTVVAVVLAAMSGVMGGEIVMLGLVALPQMLRLGYDSKLAVGVICAAGSLATLIPPSIVMIVYGLAANVPIGDLFLGGVIPGIMLATLYASYVLIRCALNHSLAPTAAEAAALTGETKTLTKAQFRAVIMCIFLIFGVMGSIYGGIASVTEAAGVGVLGACLVAAVRHELKWDMLQQSVVGTMSSVATIFWLVIGAVAYVGIYNLIGGGNYMRGLFADLGFSPIVLVLIMMLVLALLGTFMDWIAITFLTVPVFAPVIRDIGPELGLEPNQAALWFGVLFVMNVQVSFLSPPFGPACFWLKSVAPPEVTLQQIFMGVLPFIGLQLLGILLVMYYPDIVLLLPRILG